MELISDYMRDDTYRHMLNELTRNTFGFDFSPYFGRYINDDNRLINEIRSDLIEYLYSHFHLTCKVDMYSIEPGVINIVLNILQNNFSNKTIDIDKIKRRHKLTEFIFLNKIKNKVLLEEKKKELENMPF